MDSAGFKFLTPQNLECSTAWVWKLLKWCFQIEFRITLRQTDPSNSHPKAKHPFISYANPLKSPREIRRACQSTRIQPSQTRPRNKVSLTGRRVSWCARGRLLIGRPISVVQSRGRRGRMRLPWRPSCAFPRSSGAAAVAASTHLFPAALSVRARLDNAAAIDNIKEGTPDFARRDYREFRVVFGCFFFFWFGSAEWDVKGEFECHVHGLLEWIWTYIHVWISIYRYSLEIQFSRHFSRASYFSNKIEPIYALKII